MADNLANKGIRDDEPHRRGKKRGGRKPFVIESRLARNPDPSAPKSFLGRQLGLKEWWTWRRYITTARRDQALAVLVKKRESGQIRGWPYWEFRKRDD